MCFAVESGLDPSVVVPTTLWLRWHPQSTAGHHLLDHSAWGSAALEELQFLSALAVGQRVGDGNHELRVHVYFLEWFVALWFVFLWSNRSWNLNRRLGMASLHHFFFGVTEGDAESQKSSKRILGKCSRRHWADEGTRKMNHPEFSIGRVCMAVGRKEERNCGWGSHRDYLFILILCYFISLSGITYVFLN